MEPRWFFELRLWWMDWGDVVFWTIVVGLLAWAVAAARNDERGDP